MNTIYAFIGNLDNLWIAALAVILIVLDIFFLGTTHLLLLGLASLAFVLLTFAIENPVYLTWSIPVIVIIFFAGQRKLINLASQQKLPHETELEGSFDARIEVANDAAASSDYFFGYKDEKQAVSSESTKDGLRYIALLTDGRTYLLDKDSKLFDGQSVKISISKNETVKVIKYYE